MISKDKLVSEICIFGLFQIKLLQIVFEREKNLKLVY